MNFCYIILFVLMFYFIFFFFLFFFHFFFCISPSFSSSSSSSLHKFTCSQNRIVFSTINFLTIVITHWLDRGAITNCSFPLLDIFQTKVDIDVKDAQNFLSTKAHSRRKRSFTDLHQECCTEGCHTEEVMEYC